MCIRDRASISSLDEIDSAPSTNQRKPVASGPNINLELNSNPENRHQNRNIESPPFINKDTSTKVEKSETDREIEPYDPDAFVTESGNILIDLISFEM